MGFWNFKKQTKQEAPQEEVSSLYSQFSTPFGKIGDGNLSLPYVRAYGSEPYVRFGIDNLFPQIINQMYYQSPLNGSIIRFKMNAVIGGGFEIESGDDSAAQKVKEYTFLKRNKFNKIMDLGTIDLIMHERIIVLVDPTGKDVRLTRIGPEKARINAAKTMVTISDDWSRQINMVQYPIYSPELTCKSIFLFELDGVAGQDIYPIPQYCSALNWCFVDGEMSYLHKSNIINSIFPSFMIKLGKKFASEEEAAQFRKTIDAAKGAPAAGRIMTFVANEASQLPSIESIPTQQNDKLFTQTDERIDANIARAHSIDPLIMGIRVSGKLGSGNDIKQSYVIFEKNVIMPLRKMMTEFGDELLAIGGINSTIIINNYQINGDSIVDKTETI